MSTPNEKFRRRAAKTDISNLFDDLPELDEDEKSPKDKSAKNSTGPKKVVSVNTAGSELFDDLPPIEIEDGEIKDLSPEHGQISAFAKDGKGDISLSDEEIDALELGEGSEDAKKKRLAQIMARRKSKKRQRKANDGMFGDLGDLELEDE